MNQVPLPQENESGEIGHLAVQGFHAQRPDTWRPSDLSGDSDVGLDVMIQVVTNGKYSTPFHAQIKGSSVNRANATREYFSVPIKVSTANYLRTVGTPVMLVFSDQSSGQRAKSPLYYLWVHEELHAALDRMSPTASGESEITFRVPIGNLLNESLNISPYLAKWLEEQQTLDGLQRAIVASSVSVPSIEVVRQVTENVRRGGASFVESIQSSTDLPWADAPPGTVGWQLRQLNDCLTGGDAANAKRLLDELSATPISESIAAAEYQFQRARYENLTSGMDAAKPHFLAALEQQKANPRYLCARFECELHYGETEEVAQKIYDELSESPLVDDPRVKALRSRCLCLLGRYAEAEALLIGVPDQHGIVERAICMYLQHLPEEVDKILRSAAAGTTTRFTRLSLRIISLRGKFERSFKTSSYSIIPASGPPGVSAEEIQEIWREAHQLASELRERGWPQNSQILMDVLMSTGLAVGRADETLVLLDDFLTARPHLIDFQMARMKVAMFAKRHDIALEAVATLPEPSKTIHRVLVLYDKQDYDAVCKQAPQLLEISDNTIEHFLDALAVAAVAANSTINAKLEERCVARLKAIPNSEPALAVLNFVRQASSGDRSARVAASKELQEAFKRWPHSASIQDQLLLVLRARVKNEAEMAAEIAELIQKRRQLFGHEAAHLAMCLRELGRQDDAESLLEEARIRLPGDPEIPALLALLLEERGDAGRALAVLETLLNDHHDAPEMARSVYINIAARNGLVDSAIAQFHSLLVSRPTAEDRREIFRALFSLEMHGKADAVRAVAIAFQYGRCVSQNDETQEGIFLQFVATCQTLPGVVLTAEQQDEFRSRTETYVEKFPRSKYFSVIQFQRDSSPEELVRAIREKAGLTDDRLVGIQKLANGLERGTFPVPYALRPKRVLINVGSVPHLWELTKRTRLPTASYHLLMQKELSEPRDMRDLKGKIPLMDFVTLLLASDLEILDSVFKLYGRIAVSKSTLHSIQKEASHLGLQTESVLRLRASLTEKMAQIVQPGRIREEHATRRFDDDFEDFEQYAVSPPFVPYTDDFCLRLLSLGDDHHTDGLTTPDIIESCERAGIITIHEAARLYARLAGWNVGNLPITLRHFLASIPTKVNSTSRVDGKIEVLSSDPAFRSLADAVWGYSKSYENVRDHIVIVVAKILEVSPDADERLIAAIFCFWVDKTSLRPQPRFDKVQHLAQILVRTFLRLKSGEAGPRHLWGAFEYAIERLHGDRMDDEKLRRSIREIASIIAAAPNSNPELAARAGDILESISNAMGRDSPEANTLNGTYSEARAQHASKEGRRN